MSSSILYVAEYIGNPIPSQLVHLFLLLQAIFYQSSSPLTPRSIVTLQCSIQIDSTGLLNCIDHESYYSIKHLSVKCLE